MEKLKMQSRDVIGSNIHKIQELFPNCVTERQGKDGKSELGIDFEKLQAELSNDIIGEGEERYQFTWPDKRAANRLANTPTTMTLRPCREESVDFDHTQNLYIEGDNLDVLKVLRETYLGKVKMIYIDPPYNTGNDFVYNDDFTQSYSEFAESCKVYDEGGNLQYDPKANGESNGRFHTDWLNMIYPRLKVARDLLTEDGVVFISIDDNEVDNLKKICNEIFGEQSFAAQFLWTKTATPPALSHKCRKTVEYILCYERNPSNRRFFGSYLDGGDAPLLNSGNSKRKLTFPKHTVFFKYIDNGIVSIGTYEKAQILDDVHIINGYNENEFSMLATFKWGEDMLKNEIKNGTLFIIKSDKMSIRFQRLIHEDSYKTPNNFLNLELSREVGIGTNESAIKELNDLGIYGFDFPKPVSLIKYLVDMTSHFSKEGISLDFFSGSASTAHAVMQLNAEDGGNRKFIMVQLPELTDEKSEAYKAGYKNICEIGKERIRRAGKKILTNVLSGEGRADGTGYGVGMDNYDEYFKATGDKVLDIGFRVLKLDSSNMDDVYYTPQEFDADLLFNENVKEDRTSEDLLFQVMLDLGIELSAKIETRQIAGKTVHIVDEKYLAACFDRDVNETTITEIAKLHPVYFVMRDASAANDNVIDNFEQIFRHYSPDTNCRIL